MGSVKPNRMRFLAMRSALLAVSMISRGVGKAACDAAYGWEVRDRSPNEVRRLSAACAEWADAETVAAHIAYQNDVLCPNDRGRNAGASILDEINQAWPSSTYGVQCLTVGDLARAVGSQRPNA